MHATNHLLKRCSARTDTGRDTPQHSINPLHTFSSLLSNSTASRNIPLKQKTLASPIQHLLAMVLALRLTPLRGSTHRVTATLGLPRKSQSQQKPYRCDSALQATGCNACLRKPTVQTAFHDRPHHSTNPWTCLLRTALTTTSFMTRFSRALTA